eukprot:IDg13270t1
MMHGCVAVPSVHGSNPFVHCFRPQLARPVNSAFIAHPGLTKRAPARRFRSHRLCARLGRTHETHSDSPTEANLKASPLPGERWRRAAAIAATIAAGVLLPGRPHANRAATAGTSRNDPVELSVAETVASEVRGSRRQAVCVSVADTRNSYSLAQSPQLAFVDSVAAFRGKAVEVKDSLLNALTKDSDEGHSSH